MKKSCGLPLYRFFCGIELTSRSLLTFGTRDKKRALSRWKRQTDQGLTYNTTQVFPMATGLMYNITTLVAASPNGDNPPRCSLRICASLKCGSAQELTTEFQRYSHIQNAETTKSIGEATFSVECLRNAYVAMRSVTISPLYEPPRYLVLSTISFQCSDVANYIVISSSILDPASSSRAVESGSAIQPATTGSYVVTQTMWQTTYSTVYGPPETYTTTSVLSKACFRSVSTQTETIVTTQPCTQFTSFPPRTISGPAETRNSTSVITTTRLLPGINATHTTTALSCPSQESGSNVNFPASLFTTTLRVTMVQTESMTLSAETTTLRETEYHTFPEQGAASARVETTIKTVTTTRLVPGGNHTTSLTSTYTHTLVRTSLISPFCDSVMTTTKSVQTSTEYRTSTVFLMETPSPSHGETITQTVENTIASSLFFTYTTTVQGQVRTATVTYTPNTETVS